MNRELLPSPHALSRSDALLFAVAEHDVTGLKVAIKILNRRKIAAMGMEDKVWREINILKMFRHPHIIRLYALRKFASHVPDGVCSHALSIYLSI